MSSPYVEKPEEVILKNFHYASSMYISEKMLKQYNGTYVDLLKSVFGGLEARMGAYIAGQNLKEITSKYPSDWWQAFKERWFPNWLLEYYPVKYTAVKLEARVLYPEIHFPEKQYHLVLYKHKDTFLE